MSFTTDIPSFWSNGVGATLDINGGYLSVTNNLVFRTASPDGWGCNAGQTMNINGGSVSIGGDFNFGQANCYDTILMTNDADFMEIYGNWNYITSTDMEGKWTAGRINFLGSTWQVNEASGSKAVYSSGTHSILFYYPYGKQTILWDNPNTYINEEDGSLNTLRTFNFGYVDEDGNCLGVIFPYGYSSDLYWFRPWFRPYEEPDYTLYRKGWEMGDGVHIPTGNYTKTFTDLSIESPGVKSDFIRTYNSTNTEEGSFGIGWDFNIDVSKIIIPAEGYYQVVLPDGSNTTFKDNGSGGYECLNAHSTMTKDSDGYTITNAIQSKYFFNNDKELYKVEDSEGNILTISAMSGNKRIVTDSTGRIYEITYNGNSEHLRVIQINDITANRLVSYTYDTNYQLISATSVSGGTERYEYDSNGHLNKIVNCYDETTDQINYLAHGEVNYLINSAGLKQEYTYDKAQKQTGLKEYDGDKLVKTYKYDYDEKYAVKTNTVTTDGQTYDVDKITYNMVDGKNKYDEMSENVDIMGNTTRYERDGNGNVTKTTNPDGTFTLANYNAQNSITAQVDESGYATIKAYDANGTRVIKEAKSIHQLSAADINTVTAQNFDPIAYLTANESSYAITSHEYYADSYVSGVIGLIKKTTDPEGNITEYDYYTSGLGKGLVKEKWIYGNSVSKPENGIRYEYNPQLQVSKEISPEGYVKEYEYDKFNNVTITKDYGTGSSAAVTKTEYDLLSRKIKEIAPNYTESYSNFKSYTYYPSGSVKTETDAENNTTSYEYDAYGKPTKKTNPDGTINLTEYDGLQREKATYFKPYEDGINQILTSTNYEFVQNNSFDIYTSIDSATSGVCSGLKTVKTTYITAEKQVITETLADYKSNTVLEKTNDKIKRTNAYYSNGQLARQTDALGNTIKYEYGYLNQLTKTFTPFNTKPDGSVNYSITENQYNKNAKVILTKKTAQKQDAATIQYTVTKNEYNALGLLTKVTLSDGTASGAKNISQYFYNNDGVQTKMYTGMSSESDISYLTTNYVYSERNQVIRTTDSTGYNSGTIAYDLNGNVVTSTDANGNTTTNTYDALNRVINTSTINPSDSTKNISKSYTYDNMGKITNTVCNNKTTYYIYDDFGRKTQELNTENYIGYFYEGNSQAISQTITGVNNLLVYSATQNEYDDEMRLIKVKENSNDVASYTYDANGNKATETLANGITSNYSYNLNNKITNISNKKGNIILSEYIYIYCLDGSDACKIRNESGTIETTQYEYDGLKRLISESETVGTTNNTYTYQYDDYGNRSKMTATGEENYTTSYIYNDTHGNYTGLLQREIKTSALTTGSIASPIQQTVYTYDANGNQITKTDYENKIETNSYDGLNQLISFTDGTNTASYTYNINGLRATKTVNGVTTKHIWNGQQLIADVSGDIYIAKTYIRGTGLLQTFTFNYGARENRQYYLQNAHGDVVNLLNTDGAVTKTYHYDAFGVEKNIESSDDNAFRYCGEYFDKETGAIYLRARYYDPSIGRFISRDSYAGKIQDPLSLNLYTYCHNNPILGTDPSGHWLHILIGGLIGGGVELASQLIGNGGNWNDVNWTAVGVQTAVGATTAALGPLAGATVSGIGSIVTDVVKDDDGKITKDELKNITVNAAYSAGFSLIGSGAGEVAKKVGAQQLIDNLYKNNSGKAIKGIVNNFIDIPKGASVNNTKSINWLKNTHVICNGKKITEYQALGNAMMDMKKWVTVGAGSVATGYSSLIRTSYDISKKK